MTRRSKIIWLGISAVIVLGFAVRVIMAAGPWQKHRAQRDPFEKAMISLGALGVKTLESMTGTPPATDLKSACAGKLTKGAPDALLSFFGPLPDKLTGHGGELPRDQMYGFTSLRPDLLKLNFQGMPYFRDEYSMYSLWDFVFEKSREWTNRIDSFRASRPQADKGRYLLVHRLAEWTLPDVLEGGTFRAGTAVVHVRVIDPAGQPVCEGIVRPRMGDQITSHARGKTKESAQGMAQAQMHKGAIKGFGQSLEVAGLDALCDLGGELMCKATAEVIDKVDVFY